MGMDSMLYSLGEIVFHCILFNISLKKTWEWTASVHLPLMSESMHC